jgi:hypothetical protein
MQRQPDLFQVVLALHADGSLPHRLDCRQEQTNEEGENANHHQ